MVAVAGAAAADQNNISDDIINAVKYVEIINAKSTTKISISALYDLIDECNITSSYNIHRSLVITIVTFDQQQYLQNLNSKTNSAPFGKLSDLKRAGM